MKARTLTLRPERGLIASALPLLGLVVAAGAAQAQGLSATAYHQWYGPTPNDALATVALAGDVNADGEMDLIVGAPLATPQGASSGSGLARVYSGLDGALLHEVQGNYSQDHLGDAVCGLGDIDGDGFGDFAAGANLWGQDTELGALRVYGGYDGALLYERHGENHLDRFGASVVGIDDLDGDGLPDLMVGAPHADDGGHQSGLVHLLRGVDGAVLHTFVGAEGEFWGEALVALGDVNANGSPDLAIGAPLATGAAFKSGSVFVFDGADHTLIHALHGVAFQEGFGYALGVAGDVDADGVQDLIVGAAGADAKAGRARVFSGASGALLLEFAGDAPGDKLGSSVSGAGDVDGDGVPDLMAGAPEGDPGGLHWAGYARIYSGATGTPLLTLEGSAQMDQLGVSVLGGFDLPGGAAGWAVGSLLGDDPAGLGNEGSVAVYCGGCGPGPGPWGQASVTPYGSACGGLAVGHVGAPLLGSNEFQVTLHGAIPFTPTWLLVGLSDTHLNGAAILPIPGGSFGAPGCALYVSDEYVFGGVANVFGDDLRSLPVPINPALDGVKVYAEWAAVDFDANELNVVGSEGLRIVFGS